MAEFELAFKHTMGVEGGYSNLKADRGGETYKGISRRFHPSWKGWPIVERLREDRIRLAQDQDLQRLVRDFYKTKFWDVMDCDSISSQRVAEELFDTGVNMNHYKAVIFLQTALNALNRNERSYRNLVVDGMYGPRTAGCLETVLRHGDEDVLWKMLNVQQGIHYLQYMGQSEDQEIFARGWFRNRVYEGTHKA